MIAVAVALLAALGASLRSRASLQAEIAALRHQLAVLQRATPKRLRLRRADRMLWVLLSRCWSGWRSALTLVHPDTVVAWHRKGFALFWNWKSRRGRVGRPALARRIRDLVRQMADENPLWGAPRIHGELLKLGIPVAESTVSKYLRQCRPRQRPAQTWKTFLRNHLGQTVSMDFFTVPTATFRVLFVLVVLSHQRRRIVHFNVTDHPTAEWTARQIVEAFPWASAPKYLLRDRDAIYGDEFVETVKRMGMEELRIAPRSPWQSPYIERWIGSIRRECLNHVIVWNERGLRRIVKSYVSYYHETRTHLGLDKDAPDSRAVQRDGEGRVVAMAQVGGLHHRYERRAA